VLQVTSYGLRVGELRDKDVIGFKLQVIG